MLGSIKSGAQDVVKVLDAFGHDLIGRVVQEFEEVYYDLRVALDGHLLCLCHSGIVTIFGTLIRQDPDGLYLFSEGVVLDHIVLCDVIE